MTTALAPADCAERLRNVRKNFLWGSRVDPSGFRLAKGARTAIRIRGTFVAQPSGGTLVSYRIEPLPAAVVSLAIAFPLSLIVIGLMLQLAHQNLLLLLWLVPFAIVVGAANVWFSEVQAKRLVGFVRRELEATYL